VGDSKNEKPELEGKKVEIFLSTPLFRFRYEENDEQLELMENAVRLSGTIVKESAGGFILKAEALSNMRKVEKNLPFEKIFLPYGKIDFMIVA